MGKVRVPKWMLIKLITLKQQLKDDELAEFLELTTKDKTNLDADYVRDAATELMGRNPGKWGLWAVADAALSDNILRQQAFDAFKAAGYTLTVDEARDFTTWGEEAVDLMLQFAQFVEP